MITEIQLFFKSSRLGRWLLPIIVKIWRIYKVPAQRKLLQRVGYDVMREISSISSSEGILITPMFGTLLGFVRDKGFIPHDDDLDLAVFTDRKPKEIAKILVEKYRFNFVRALSYHGEVTELTMKYRGVPIDFFWVFEEGNEVRFYAYYWKESEPYTDPKQNHARYIAHPLMKEFEVIEIHGVKVTIPTNFEPVLEADYGKGWRFPDPNFVDEGNPGEVLLPDYGYTVTWDDLMNDKIVKN